MIRSASSLSAGRLAARQVKLRTKNTHTVFAFRISAALEIKSGKRAKCCVTKCARLSWWEGLHLIEDANRLQRYRPHDFEALGVELVHRVLGRVPEDVVVAVGKINQVDRRHA